jgi:hypothetical protein
MITACALQLVNQRNTQADTPTNKGGDGRTDKESDERKERWTAGQDNRHINIIIHTYSQNMHAGCLLYKTQKRNKPIYFFFANSYKSPYNKELLKITDRHDYETNSNKTEKVRK